MCVLCRILVNYRYERIETSQEIARSYGNQGTKFAWESAFTGLEEVRAQAHFFPFRIKV